MLLRDNIDYKVKDGHKFITGFYKLVDTSVDYLDYMADRWVTDSEYFGKIQWGMFTIYSQHKFLWKRRTILKIRGKLTDGKLDLDIRLHYRWVEIVYYIYFNLIMLIIPIVISQLPDLMTWNLEWLILLIPSYQTYWIFEAYDKGRDHFLEKMEEIVLESNSVYL
jgi:hypothetical protein